MTPVRVIITNTQAEQGLPEDTLIEEKVFEVDTAGDPDSMEAAAQILSALDQHFRSQG